MTARSHQSGEQRIELGRGSPHQEEASRELSHKLSCSEALVVALRDLGVEQAFGIFGGGIAPFCAALERSPIRLMHFRHESGAAFAAIEASLASGKPTVVVATTGPGLTNLYTGMVAARSEGAKVLFVSGGTSAAQRGRMPFQETSAYASAAAPFFAHGHLFHFAAMVEDPAELEVVVSRLQTGVAKPGGFVAHVGLPLFTQTAKLEGWARGRLSSGAPPIGAEGMVRTCAELLAPAPFVIWAGFGARGAASAVRELSRRTGARVMCTPRGKGVVPETDPLYLGVTGLGGHDVASHLARARPARALVLGTRLGEMSSFYSSELIPAEGLVHVDLDPAVFGAAFPHVPTVGVESEIGAFLEQLLAVWPEDDPPTARSESARVRAPPLAAREHGPVRPSYLMARVQRTFVDQSSAIVLTEAGNSFALGSHYLRFAEPGRYRVSTSFGSMGQASAGVLGAALGRSGKAVAIVGDGAMLMHNEMNTAATYGIDAVWIVLNDARYGMIAQGMCAFGWQPFGVDFARADFVAVARGMGADGVRVEEEAELDAALALAERARGPFVVDVVVDTTEPVPNLGRNQSLLAQGVNAEAP